MFVQDLDQVKLIHERHFQTEFEFPDFGKFTSLFVVENKDKQIITAGGIKPIAECILITDKDYNVNDRVRALHKALDISGFLSRYNNYEQLHCFVQDELWCRQLEGHGFQPTKGKALVLNL